MRSPTPSAGLDPAPTGEWLVTRSLGVALLLAYAGGSLDTFLYLNHGRVFAGAMTGNAVLCGIAMLSGDGREAVRHVLPLLAFFAGVWVAEWLEERLRPHAVTIGLSCEAGGLIVCSLLPATFPELVFVPLVALLAAYQVASFRKVDEYAYNSTFITGNLRIAILGLRHATLTGRKAEGWKQARDLGGIVLAFGFGAVSGAAVAPHFGNHTLWLPAAALLAVLGRVWWKRRDRTAARSTA